MRLLWARLYLSINAVSITLLFFLHTGGKIMFFNDLSFRPMIESKIGTMASSDKAKHHGKFDEKRSALVATPNVLSEVLKSICSRTEEPRSGSNPTPEILSQPMSFSTFNVFTASIDRRMPLISSSVNFDARILLISPKFSVSELKQAPCPNAAAIIARDGLGRYPPIN
jgi:hypothetical protein